MDKRTAEPSHTIIRLTFSGCIKIIMCFLVCNSYHIFIMNYSWCRQTPVKRLHNIIFIDVVQHLINSIPHNVISNTLTCYINFRKTNIQIGVVCWGLGFTIKIQSFQNDNFHLIRRSHNRLIFIMGIQIHVCVYVQIRGHKGHDSECDIWRKWHFPVALRMANLYLF